jgi:hypothetical protein
MKAVRRFLPSVPAILSLIALPVAAQENPPRTAETFQVSGGKAFLYACRVALKTGKVCAIKTGRGVRKAGNGAGWLGESRVLGGI